MIVAGPAESRSSTGTGGLVRIGIGKTAYAVGVALCLGVLAACGHSGSAGAPPTSLPPATSQPTSSSPSTPTGAAYDDAQTVQAVLLAARNDLPLITAFDYQHLNADMAQGLAVTTGTFHKLYETTMRKTVFPRATKLHAVQTTTVSNVGLVGLGTTQAEVLAFGVEKVTDSTSSTPQVNALTASVVMTKVGSTWAVSDVHNNSADAIAAPGTQELKNAISVGQSEASALLTYHRKTFDADLARAEAGASGPLLADVKGQATKLREQMTSGHFDLKPQVHAAAIESVQPREVVLLVAVDTYQVPDHGKETLQLRERLEVDVVEAGTTWYVDTVSPVT